MNEDLCRPTHSDQIGTSPDILREVLDGVVAFVGILTPEGILTEANAPALDAAKLEHDDVIGKPFWECYWWNFGPAAQGRLREAVAKAAAGEPVRHDTEVRIADDQRIIIDFQLLPHRDGHGRVDFLIASGVDVTARVRHEALLRAARDTFADMVINSPFGIYVVDADFRLAMVSTGAQKVFSQVRPLIGRDFAEILRALWPEPFASQAIDRFRQTLDTGEPYHAPRTVERRNDIGEVEAYDWKIERIELPDGRPGVVCHFYDLSEREEHEAALRASEARFRATFDNPAVGIAHVSPERRWLRVNQKLCEITGYAKEDLIGRNVYDITHPDDHHEDRAMAEAFADGKHFEYQLRKRYIRKDGSNVWVRVTVGSVRDDAGALDYYIKVIEDISAEMAAEARQNLLIGELNHRVKNILATVQAMASQTMRASPDMKTFRQAFTGRIQAMAAAHDSIFQSGGVLADIETVVRNQLAPYAGSDMNRLRLSGPALRLDGNGAHALGLILHELATNAAKYGALVGDGGTIAVSWEPFVGDGARSVRLIWSESGGPPVTPPGANGFGSQLIDATLRQTLEGEATFDYRPEGLKVELTFAMSEAASA